MFNTKDLQYCARYPFTEKTREVVKFLKFDLKELDPLVLDRAKQRAIDGIESNIVNPITDSKSQKILLTEILSFPVAKIIVSLTRDGFLQRRYAQAEANFLKKSLNYFPEETKEIINELGIEMNENKVSFVDYANNCPREDDFRLVNSLLKEGVVELKDESLISFTSQLLKNKLTKELKQKFDVPEIFEGIARELIKETNRNKAFESTREVNLGEVDMELFPPCMKALINDVQSGSPIAHQPRFVLATFLVNVNMPTDAIVEIYKNTPNFNEKKTRYYIEYSRGKKGSGTKYSVAGCEKMIFYNLCVNKDALCERIKNPISYYIVKKRGSKK